MRQMDKFQKGWSGFIEMCQNTSDQKTFLSLLDLFLTPEEKVDLAKRYLIVRELLQNEKSQRQISKELEVSIAKITRGSNELKRMNKKLLAYLKDEIMK
jgi:TrpR family trp operon transcriptional repressor